MSGRALVRWLLLVLVLLSACAAPGVPLRAPASAEAATAALPLIELPVAGSSRLAIVLSGDGGWSAIDQGIAAELNRQGISVLGWNSLRYFWKEKAPAQVAADLAATMGHYGQRWQADNIALVGYSFGADMLPFVYPHLPPAQRRQVRFVSLLGMAHEADFSVRIGGWLGLKSRRAHALRPLLAGLQPVPVQCIYGIREKDSLCRELQGAITQVVARPGGHHFDGDNAALARIIIGGWEAADSAQP